MGGRGTGREGREASSGGGGTSATTRGEEYLGGGQRPGCGGGRRHRDKLSTQALTILHCIVPAPL